MTDLFGDALEPIDVSMSGATLIYYPHLEVGVDASILLDRFIRETPWREEEVTLWGKKYLQPRLVAWYGDEGTEYTYSGVKLKPLPWTSDLRMIKERIEAVTKSKFNSVLLNYYRNNKDSMGFHSDNESELGTHPIIASYSLGEERTLIFKSIFDKSLKPVHLKLKSSSLLLMRGDTQKNWAHGIEKSARPLGPRVNLTFRHINHR